MKYVDCVEMVLDQVGEASKGPRWGSGGGEVARMSIASALGLKGDEATEAVYQAVADLTAIGMVESADSLFIRLTQLGRQAIAEGIRSAWLQIAEIFLEDDQQTYLAKAITLGERQRDSFAFMEHVDSQDIFDALDWGDATYRADGFARPLQAVGFVDVLATGAYVKVRPTYLGTVRGSEAEAAAAHTILNEVLADGETSNVEVKRRLDLDSNQGKAKLVRESLALATTRMSGRRFLLIGYDDDTLKFVESVSPKVTKERIEQILHAYTSPTPETRFWRLRENRGNAVLIELLRDPTLVPYRVSRDVGDLRVGEVKVRHGTASEEPTPQELDDLEQEGRRARSESSDLERRGA